MQLKRTLVFMTLLTLCISPGAVFANNTPKSFTSDLCTFWPDASDKYNWSRCCLIHDLYYWAGGDENHRRNTDLKFRACVKEASNVFISQVMYWGVKMGSKSPVKIPGKHWGNAWSDKVRTTKLNHDEIDQLSLSLNENNSEELSFEEIDQFIDDLRELEARQY